MSEINPVRELHSLIKSEEQRILNSYPLEGRLGLMEISRSMDLAWINIDLGNVEYSEETTRMWQLFSFGINKAIYLFLDRSCNFPSFPLGKSTEMSKNWADSVLIHCGRLGLCEYFLEINRIGLSKLEKESDYLYRFQFSSNEPIGLESFEKEDFIWKTQFVAGSQANQLRELEQKQRKIWNIMSKLVDTWETDFIQYKAHPEVDQFYNEAGILRCQRMFDQDAFPSNVKFGGQDFSLYRKTVEVLTGWTLKHTSFCTQLVKKAPNIDFANIITVPQNFEDKVLFLTYVLDIDFKTANHLLETLTLTYENKDTHCLTSGDCATPAFIKVGQGRVIAPILGCTTDPFRFMLNELKRKYRSDWDNAVNQREKIFKQDIYALFKDSRFLKLERNLNIKIGGLLLTDIDALIVDRSTGVLGLFQLKWQDRFVTSMRERESKKTNFQKTCNQWVERVYQWLAENSISEICKLCGLDDYDAETVNEFRVFVIGRNAAHFSGIGVLDSRAAWGTWYQMLRLCSESITSANPLTELHTLMIQTSPLKKQLEKIPREEIKIGNITIIAEIT